MNLESLNYVIDNSGISITLLAKRLGISRQQLYKKLSGDVEFKVSEANDLADILRLTKDEKENIFFANHSA
ncbi:helix-turn-helix domain-containing protein [Microaceticoccus formicicus]|uniref:helix-turn-helix domain-containing protein n=1 Tax=Microaceticoccus formicicus TaxID=3118105 RepID=UPI003CD05016|nr:helix-turn-helix domain-containing protein [Peptoniphilaceae bacterium AMB_02]